MDVTPRHRRFRHCCVALFFSPLAALAAADSVARVEQAATEWVKLRAETVRLETEWSGQRGLFEAMVAALAERARLVEEKTANSRARTVEERAELDGLEQRNRAASAALATAETRLAEVGRNLAALRPFLPPRLAAALELPLRSLADPALPVADRMEHTMTVLNRCLQFNRGVTTGEETIAPAGEPTPRAVEVIYWGLSHAYAFDRTTRQAWLGRPGPDGWSWQARPEAADGVARLLAIAADRADPDFVLVPAQLNSVAQ
jgi:hypothetical protein